MGENFEILAVSEIFKKCFVVIPQENHVQEKSTS